MTFKAKAIHRPGGSFSPGLFNYGLPTYRRPILGRVHR